MSESELFAGLMSGTSLDGVDAVLVRFDSAVPRVLAHVHRDFPAALRGELADLCAAGANEIERAGRAGGRLAEHYAQATVELFRAGGVPAGSVRAVGCHGQTVRHRPGHGFTVQIGNPALLAELTGTTIVADFRSRDIAAGGQGAPLAPAFHAAMFASPQEARVVLNLGGIANLTWLPRDGSVTGFDTGPGNGLLDLWAERHIGQRFDESGRWGAGATCHAGLLARLLDEPFFGSAPPRSTGRELFNAAWLQARLPDGLSPQVVQATLLELTAASVAQAIAAHCLGAERLIVCGGGTLNQALLERLAARVAPCTLESSAAHGIDPQQVEAVAFAWLAQKTLQNLPGNLPGVTGARGPRVLGAIYPR